MPDATYTPDEIATRAKEIYSAEIRDKLSPEDDGRFLAVDITTGQYAIDDEFAGASRLLRERLPDAVGFILRVGHDAAVYLRSPRVVSSEDA